MKYQIAILSWLAATSPAIGEETLREFAWEKLQAAGVLRAGQVIQPDDASAPAELLIENASGESRTVHILTIEDPAITGSTYALKGHVRYEDVEGAAHLVMLSYFPEGPASSKGLARSGPLGSISGSSDRRPFVLPFFMKGGDVARLQKIELNVVMPGRATIHVGPLRLVQFDPGENPLMAAGQWWSDRSAGLIGGIGGSLIGCLGALIGCLAGTGRARTFVLSLVKLMLVLGLAMLAAGVVALAQSQPYGVYYPLLLVGGITTLLMAALRPNIRKRYEQLEMRKIDAMDIA